VLQDWRCPFEEIKVGTGRKLKDGDDVAVLSIGPIGNNVTEAIKILKESGARSQESGARSQESGARSRESGVGSQESVSVAHYDMRFLKPIDEQILEEVGRKFKRIITVENGVKQGGLGSAVLEWMNDHGYSPEVIRLGLPDQFVEHGKVCELNKIVGLDPESIAKAILMLPQQ
jgi:1-deoxy-D-xylulose-5-phosphate synthase